MIFLFLLFQSTLVGLVPAQQHNVHTNNVLCYHCDNVNNHRFPHCLEHPISCRANEVCLIRYGYRLSGHTPLMECRQMSDCNHQLSGHTKVCPEGGVQTHPDQCQQCCENDQCTTDIADVLKMELLTSPDLFCPHTCHVGHLKTCVNDGRICDHGEFCEIRVDHALNVHGDCRKDHDFQHCKDGLQQVPCPDDLTNATAYTHAAHHRCYSDCCDTNQCLFKRFGIHLANATLPTNQQTHVTSSPTGHGSDLWDQLRGNCVDTFSNITCEGLKNQSDLCHSRLALSMCPKTCGICDAVQTSTCKDWKLDDCAQVVANRSITFCDTTEAVFTCPRTCNVCDKLLDSIIVSLIDGTSNSTRVPPSLLPTMTPNPHTDAPTTPYPTVNCDDLKSVACEHLGPICESTFMGAVCPAECQACFNNI